MFTFLGFFIGLILMALGFLMVWKTNYFLQFLGDISVLFGAVGARWLSWKLLGIAFLLIGFLTAFGLFETFFALTIGRLFSFGG